MSVLHRNLSQLLLNFYQCSMWDVWWSKLHWGANEYKFCTRQNPVLPSYKWDIEKENNIKNNKCKGYTTSQKFYYYPLVSSEIMRQITEGCCLTFNLSLIFILQPRWIPRQFIAIFCLFLSPWTALPVFISFPSHTHRGQIIRFSSSETFF